MYPITDAALAALASSYTIATSQILSDPSTGSQLLPGLRLAGGNVVIDRTADYRRQCTVSVVVESGVVPSRASDPLAPYGNRVQLYRGLWLPATGIAPAQQILFPLGVFRLSKTGVDDNEDGSLAVSFSGYDGSRQIARNKFTDAYIIATGQNYATAIGNLVTDRLPGTVLDIPVTAEVTPQLIFAVGDDPWKQIQGMCDALGWECFFTVDGAFRAQPVPDVATAPIVYSLVEGDFSPLTDVARDFDDDPGFNGVVFSGESSSLATPVSAITWDTDPSSPTYYQGKYGPTPDVQTSPYIGSVAQAQAAGAAWILKNRGGTDGVSFSGLVNPALDASDIVRVKRTRSGIDTAVMIESLTIPLDAASKMTGTGARRMTT